MSWSQRLGRIVVILQCHANECRAILEIDLNWCYVYILKRIVDYSRFTPILGDDQFELSITLNLLNLIIQLNNTVRIILMTSNKRSGVSILWKYTTTSIYFVRN